jgi:hypothetical protein
LRGIRRRQSFLLLPGKIPTLIDSAILCHLALSLVTASVCWRSLSRTKLFLEQPHDTDGAPGHEHLILKRPCFLRARAMPKDGRHRAASPSSRAVTTRTSTTNTCPTVPRCLPAGRKTLYHLCPLRINNTSTSNILPRRRTRTLRANLLTTAVAL